MTIDNIPEALKTQLRISILASIYNGEKDFNTLKEILDTTDGNLSVQISKLEDFGCVVAKKDIVKKKSRTTCAITEYGRRIFGEYVEMLTQSIKNDQ